MTLKINLKGDVILTTSDINELNAEDEAYCILEIEQWLNSLIGAKEVFVSGKRLMFYPRFHLWKKEEKNGKKTKEG